MPEMPWATVGLACLASLGTLLISITFLIDWIQNWKRVKAYWEYGVLAGLVALGFTLVSNLAVLGSMVQESPEAWLGALVILLVSLAIGVFGATRIGGFVMLGMHYAAEMGERSFPLLQRWFGDQPARATESVPAIAAGTPPAVVVHDAPAVEGVVRPESLPPELSTPEGLSPPAKPVTAAAPPLSVRRMALSTLAVVVIAVTYSSVLFKLTSPRISVILRSIPGLTEEAPPGLTLSALVLLLQAAFSEEIVYRLGVQGFLVRYLKWQGRWYWLAIVLSSALWTLGHAGSVDPDWVKFAQIFPAGLMLGWLFRKCGAGSCIVAHALFNLAMVLLPSSITG